jgi:CRISPR/Cas system-associated exonuclease Cas4 (RecB family)
MGAETKVFVRVIVARAEWREVYAVTLDEAKRRVADSLLPEIERIISAQYEVPDDLRTAQ